MRPARPDVGDRVDEPLDTSSTQSGSSVPSTTTTVRPRWSASSTRAIVSAASGTVHRQLDHGERGRRRVDRVDAGTRGAVGAAELGHGCPSHCVPRRGRGEGDVGVRRPYDEGVTVRTTERRRAGRRGRRVAATATAADPDTSRTAVATDVRSATMPMSGEASRNPSRAPDENAAIPLCEPWVRSAAERNSSGNSDDRPRPATNRPHPAAIGAGQRRGHHDAGGGDAAPPRRVGSTPSRSVTRSPSSRPTSIPLAMATNPSPA